MGYALNRSIGGHYKTKFIRRHFHDILCRNTCEKRIVFSVNTWRSSRAYFFSWRGLLVSGSQDVDYWMKLICIKKSAAIQSENPQAKVHGFLFLWWEKYTVNMPQGALQCILIKSKGSVLNLPYSPASLEQNPFGGANPRPASWHAFRAKYTWKSINKWHVVWNSHWYKCVPPFTMWTLLCIPFTNNGTRYMCVENHAMWTWPYKRIP